MRDPDTLDHIFNGLARIEGAASTLRGSLFEFAVAQISKTTFAGCEIEVNRIVTTNTGAKAEIDVLALQKHKEIIFIECKGTHPANLVDDTEVAKWLKERVPVLRKYAKEHTEWKALRHRFELWTSGQCSPVAKALVETAKQETNKYSVELRDANYVLAQAVASQDAGLRRTYEQHFVRHPMQEYVEAKKRASRKAARNLEMTGGTAGDTT